MSLKKSLRIVLGLCVIAAPVALLGCDEQKPTTPVATPAAAPAATTTVPGK